MIKDVYTATISDKEHNEIMTQAFPTLEKAMTWASSFVLDQETPFAHVRVYYFAIDKDGYDFIKEISIIG